MSIKVAALFLGIAFSINSCTSNNSGNAVSASKNTRDTFSDPRSEPMDSIKGGQSGGQLKSAPDSPTALIFTEGVKSLSVRGNLNKPGDVVIYTVTVIKGARLTGRIEADKSRANIRFNQIVMPDGQSDGPFGQQLEYPLSQKGVYKIKIGQNLMAENAFVGDFLLYLTVE